MNGFLSDNSHILVRFIVVVVVNPEGITIDLLVKASVLQKRAERRKRKIHFDGVAVAFNITFLRLFLYV